MIPDAAVDVEVARSYRCPCGCGWIRDDVSHLAAYLRASGYGLSALAEAAK